MFPQFGGLQWRWNEKNDLLKEIKLDTRPWKEKDETVINRLRAGHTLLTHGYLMDGIAVLPQCKLCHNHTMTLKLHLTECANVASLRLRFFDGFNPIALKRIQGRNKVNSNTIKSLKKAAFNRRLLRYRALIIV